MSQLVFSFLKAYQIDIGHYDVLVPVPLHPTRYRERGYNQAELIASVISQTLAIPLLPQNLLRCRHTQNQARIGRKERWTNIQGAFTIRHSKKFLNRRVLLIDDLLTTGATASEAARVLKETGAARVDVVTVAIASKKHLFD